ncbi:hypothetical protein [Actinomadura sp. 7K534]|uniref:golvesin C-terminal-like domain-containing protein n=1 Tax=Actinomadura sp. 7K534 TaxID=2530366 RepID=UPI001051C71B|nr:hypothetical protein [Actinomadura sp. 7K534]TDB99258.1 hypothetical protein E1266_00235 [Actinomadura sp. 7K534]
MAPGSRDKVLGPGWRSSGDRAWTTTGDSSGLHVLVAEEKNGYAWRNVATLSEPGFDADQWIGNACLTGSGKRAVVAYAPRAFTNKPPLNARGAFTAVVDLASGSVRKLPLQSSLAYFSPGCGTGEDAVITQEGGAGSHAGKTRLTRVDAVTGRLGTATVLTGQVTSAVPVGRKIVAADGHRLVRVSKRGGRTPLTKTSGVPFHLAADADGGVVFMERGQAGVSVRRSAGRPGPAKELATGVLGQVGVQAGAGGRVFLTGRPAKVGALPPKISRVDVPRGAEVSSHGRSALLSAAGGGAAAASPRGGEPAPVPVPRRGRGGLTLKMKVLATGEQPELSVSPGDATAGRKASPVLGGSDARPRAAADGSPTNPVESERTCSVPRNDPRNQAYQPTPRQVEWAVDQAVRGALTIQRPQNWKNLGMPAYTPQGLFPRAGLTGGGYIPAQVMLGVAAQESNLWQASRWVTPGETGNPLIGNYYGLNLYDSSPANDWDIDFSEADCGYGITQRTDGMRLAGREKPGETALPYQHQRAVALDFTANIASGVRLLEQKWNQTMAAGMRVNNGDPAKPENWFFALWSYNSGFYPNEGGPWGVGWANNPINPRYPADRAPFLSTTYADAKNPQWWPYQEKVLGWAAYPIEALEKAPDTYVPGYRAAWWNTDIYRLGIKPPAEMFCNSSNYCTPGAKYPNDLDEPEGPCSRRDLKCWFHQPITWKNCPAECGNEVLRFDPGYAYQPDQVNYPPTCTLNGLPSGSLVIDDVPDGTPTPAPNCGRPWSNAGAFTFDFAADSGGKYPSKIDLHQMGGGFGGHYYFGHTRDPDRPHLRVSGAWKLDREINGPAQVLVHLPDHYGYTHRATYEVETARGTRKRTISQRVSGNQWLSIGAFMFDGRPSVKLSSVVGGATGDETIAFDALAVRPIKGTYVERTVDAVALFDETQNINTDSVSSWFLNSPVETHQKLYDWGLETAGRVLALPTCDGTDEECAGPHMKSAMQTWRNQIITAGTDPLDHPPGQGIANWIHFANPYTDRPTSSSKPGHFDTDDTSYKIKASATVSFIRGEDGAIVDGSPYVEYDDRTGDTVLPDFVKNTLRAIELDYGIDRPDLTYTTEDLNEHDGRRRTARPHSTGILPGRAYLPLHDQEPAPIVGGCVPANSVSGGSIGYRPMLGEAGPAAAMQAWIDTMSHDFRVHPNVTRVVREIYNLFFHRGATGSPFNMAAPIWQQLSFMVCADGTIHKNGGRPILRSSFMPDQYLYFEGRAINTDGQPVGSGPIINGNFRLFSRLPDGGSGIWDNPYGSCSGSGQSGNPWNIAPPGGAGTNPDSVHFCV